MRFNTNGSNDPLFSCYASGQTDVYLYEVTYGEPTYTYADMTQKVYEFLRDANKVIDACESEEIPIGTKVDLHIHLHNFGQMPNT